MAAKWGEMYEEAEQLTGINYQRLADLKWVSQVFEFSYRNENLSWKHDRAIAPDFSGPPRQRPS